MYIFGHFVGFEKYCLQIAFRISQTKIYLLREL